MTIDPETCLAMEIFFWNDVKMNILTHDVKIIY